MVPINLINNCASYIVNTCAGPLVIQKAELPLTALRIVVDANFDLRLMTDQTLKVSRRGFQHLAHRSKGHNRSSGLQVHVAYPEWTCCEVYVNTKRPRLRVRLHKPHACMQLDCRRQELLSHGAQLQIVNLSRTTNTVFAHHSMGYWGSDGTQDIGALRPQTSAGVGTKDRRSHHWHTT